MAFPLSSFGWVCEAYPCPANAIFPQLELIQTLSREFDIAFRLLLIWLQTLVAIDSESCQSQPDIVFKLLRATI